MGANIDDTKGRAKEAAGALTNDKGLKTEGKADQVGAKVKGVLGSMKGRAENAVDAVKEKLAEKKSSQNQ